MRGNLRYGATIGIPCAAAVALSWLLMGRAPAQEAAKADSLARIDADYQRERARLDRDRIARLTRLAESQHAGEAEATWLEIFRFAVATDHYADAEPAADRALRGSAATRELEFLARLTKILAKADRGDFDGSMRDLRAYLAAAPDRPASAPADRGRTVQAVAEAYFRRLVRARRFDLAREVCDHVVKRAGDAAVRDHFAGYRRRLELVGRPAPAIEGTDPDGAGVALDDFKGKAVLVVFWATWCPPCVERLPALNHALERHEKEGFAVLGVNLDREEDRDQRVRRFVVDFGIPWRSVLNASEQKNVAAAYSVTEIPANVLVGRDGRVITFDVGPADLLDAVAAATKRRAEALPR